MSLSPHEPLSGWRHTPLYKSSCHRQRTKFASPHVFDRLGHAGEHDLHLSTEQIDKRGTRAAIRHVHEVDAGHHFEQFTENMVSGTDAAMSRMKLKLSLS